MFHCPLFYSNPILNCYDEGEWEREKNKNKIGKLLLWVNTMSEGIRGENKVNANEGRLGLAWPKFRAVWFREAYINIWDYLCEQTFDIFYFVLGLEHIWKLYKVLVIISLLWWWWRFWCPSDMSDSITQLLLPFHCHPHHQQHFIIAIMITIIAIALGVVSGIGIGACCFCCCCCWWASSSNLIKITITNKANQIKPTWIKLN